MDAQPGGRARPERWRDWRWLLVVSGVALVIRLLWLASHGEVIENEGAAYARLAESLLSGSEYASYVGGRNTIFPPLYPMGIAAFAVVTGSTELGARLLSTVSGVALIWPVYGVAMYLGGRRSALVASILAAGSGVFVALSASAYSESTFFLLWMLGVYFTCAVLDGSPPLRHALAAGASFGAAYLIRPEALAWAALAVLFTVANAVIARRSWRATALAVGAIGVSVILIASPYVAWLSVNSGYLRWEGKSLLNGAISDGISEGKTYQEAGYGIGPNLEREGAYLVPQFAIAPPPEGGLSVAVTSILADPVPRLVDYARGIAAPSGPGGPALVLFALIGLASSMRDPRYRPQKLFFASAGVLYPVVLLSVQFQWDRFLFPLVLLAVPWAAVGITAAAATVATHGSRLAAVARRRSLAEGILVAGAVAVVLIPTYRYASTVGEFTQSASGDLKAAGLWLRDKHATTVMGMTGVVPYYAGASLEYLPWTEDEAAALRYVHAVAPDFLFLRNGDEIQNPYIGRWVRDGIPDACAVPVKTFPQQGGGHLSIYEWACTTSAAVRIVFRPLPTLGTGHIPGGLTSDTASTGGPH